MTVPWSPRFATRQESVGDINSDQRLLSGFRSGLVKPVLVPVGQNGNQLVTIVRPRAQTYGKGNASQKGLEESLQIVVKTNSLADFLTTPTCYFPV